MRMRSLEVTVVAIGLALIAMTLACSTAPVKPETQHEALLVAEMEYTAILQTAVDLRRQGFIDDDAYDKLDDLFARANLSLHLAHIGSEVGDEKSAAENLTIVRDLLLELRTVDPQFANPEARDE